MAAAGRIVIREESAGRRDCGGRRDERGGVEGRRWSIFSSARARAAEREEVAMFGRFGKRCGIRGELARTVWKAFSMRALSTRPLSTHVVRVFLDAGGGVLSSRKADGSSTLNRTSYGEGIVELTWRRTMATSNADRNDAIAVCSGRSEEKQVARGVVGSREQS